MRFRFLIIVCGVCFLFLAAARRTAAAAPWTLTTADFQKRQVDLLSITAGAVTVRPAGGDAPLRIAMDEFVGVARIDGPAPAPNKPAFTLHLAGGGRLAGAPGGISGETLAWNSDAIGQVAVGVRSIAGMTRGAAPLPHSAQPPAADRVRLANGDVLEGAIADISGEGVAVTAGAQLIPVPLESVTAVIFAGSAAPARDERGFQLRLADGSIIGGGDLSCDGQTVTFSVAGEARRLPLAGIRSIDQVNGPVAWLSDLTPARDEQTPFIGEPVPTRFNTTLDGKPLAIGDRRFARGIAVHARSVLEFELPGGFETFRTQYAIEGDRPQANVTIRVKLDGGTVHEQKDVVAGRVYPVVAVPLAGARRLTLEADYGQTYDVQDRVLWLEPALVR